MEVPDIRTLQSWTEQDLYKHIRNLTHAWYKGQEIKRLDDYGRRLRLPPMSIVEMREQWFPKPKKNAPNGVTVCKGIMKGSKCPCNRKPVPGAHGYCGYHRDQYNPDKKSEKPPPRVTVRTEGALFDPNLS